MKQYICIDIGGTSIKYGLLKESLTFVKYGSIPTESYLGGPSVLKKAMSLVGNYLDGDSADGICISTAGMVDSSIGEIIHASSLIPDYTGTKIKERMEETFHLPCEVENDVNCAGIAEHFTGASKGTSVSLCLTIGTGIGGSILINGEVFHGFSNSACEVGYMHLPGGDFQDLGAASILVKNASARKKCNEYELNGKLVFDLAKEGDTDCIQAIDDMVDILGKGIANICYVINPEIVVLGGGIMAQKDYLYDKIRNSMDRYLIPIVASKTKLAFALNQNNAGMIGAYFHFKGKHA